MEFKSLEKMISPLIRKDKKLSVKASDIHLTNIWKDPKNKNLHIGIYRYDSNFFGKSFYIASIEFDVSGKIVAINYRDSESNAFDSLIGQTIPLSKLKLSHHRLIKDKPVGVEDSYILGFISETGGVTILNKKNLHTFPFQKDSCTGRAPGTKESSVQSLEHFQKFHHTYQKQLESFCIEERGIRTFRFRYLIEGFSVYVEFSQFFRNSLKIQIDTNIEEDSSFSEMIYLKEYDEQKFRSILLELRTKKLSCYTKFLMLVGDNSFRLSSEDVSNSVIKADLSFDERFSKGPKGTYTFEFDFVKNSVACESKKSKTFIPKTVKRLNEKLHFLASL